MYGQGYLADSLATFAAKNDCTIQMGVAFLKDRHLIGDAQERIPDLDAYTFDAGKGGLTNRCEGDNYEVVELCLRIREDRLHRIGALCLAGSFIDDEGAAALAELLKYTSDLRVLDLYGSRISERGCELIIDALKENISLEELNLRRNGLTFKNLEDLLGILNAQNGTLRRVALVNVVNSQLDSSGKLVRCINAIKDQLKVNAQPLLNDNATL